MLINTLSGINAITQLSGINIPEEHERYNASLIRFEFLVPEELILRKKIFQVSDMTDCIGFANIPYFYFYGTI